MTIAIVAALAVSQVRWAIIDWNLNDVDVYWDAAVRLRSGESPYAASAAIDVLDPSGTYRYYRYAPWFAAAWTPLTFLPRNLIEILWSIGLLAASFAVALRPVQQGIAGVLCAGLIAALLLGISSGGNVQPLLVASLLFGIERRSGPLWIALAASLKIVPILFVLIYVARREWRRAALTLGLTGALIAPALAYDLPRGLFDPGPASTMPFEMFLVVALTAMIGAFIIAVKRPVYGPLAVSVAAVLALPRLLTYEVTLVAVGLAEPRTPVEPEAAEGRMQK